MSPRLLKVSPAVSEIFRDLIQRWPNNKKDAAQLILYVEDIAALVEECGLKRVLAAVKAARTNCNFIPEPGELRKLLPSQEVYGQPPQWHDPNCRDCGGSGWKPVLIVEISTGRPERQVTRCACKPPARPNPAPRANPEQYRAFIKEALESVKTINQSPPDPNRRMELKTQMARIQTERPASQAERTAAQAEVAS